MSRAFSAWREADAHYREVLGRLLVHGRPAVNDAYLSELAEARERSAAALRDYLREIESEVLQWRWVRDNQWKPR